MNHIYRSIWNVTLGAWVAAPETASTGGKVSRSRTICQPPVDGMRTSAPRSCLRQRAPVWVAVLALCGPASAADIELSTVGDSHDISATGSQTVDNFRGVAGTTLKLGGSTLTFGTVTSGTFAGEISGTGGLVKQGAGTQTLSGANTYSGGTTLNAGTLIVGNNAALGSGALTVAGAATLDSSSALTLANAINLGTGLTLGGSNALALSGVIDGTGGLTKNGGVNLTLSGANTYSGGTTLNAGTLTVGNNAALGTGALTVAGAATLDTSSALTLGNAINLGAGLTLSGSNALALSGVIGGTGGLTKTGSGTLTLTGANTLSGNTTVNAGLLKVDGTLSSSNVQVNAGASLGGAGNLLGAVDIANGAHLQGQSGQILSTGHLTLHSGTSIGAALGSPLTGGTALFNVNGNLTLDGTLDVTDIGGFGMGVYRLFDYSGGLVNNGLVFGALPGSVMLGDLTMQTSISNQVNLVVGGAPNVMFWDGSQSVANGTIEGGTGTWSGAGTNWTDANGTLNTYWNGRFAIFQGTSGEVTVVGTHTAPGLQFVTSGYRLIGSGGLNMVNGSSGAFDVRVDPGASASIDVALSGSGTLAKVGNGTLVLNGANSYTGGTHVNAGMLTVNGSVAGNVAVASGATLAGTGSVGTTTVSGATIAPGSASTPYGTLTVAGNLNMDSGSTLRVAVDPSANQAGKLSVGGTAALNGTLQVDGQSLNFNGADRTYTVVSAQSVTGQFANVAANFAFLTATADYSDSTKVDLKLTRKTVTPSSPITFVDLAQTGNQRVVAQALEGMSTSSALHNFVLGLPNGAPPAVFAQISGDSHAGVQGSLPSLDGLVPRTSQKRLHNNLTAGLRAGAPIAQSDGPLPASAWPTSKALPAWVEVVGHRQTLDGNSNAPGVKQNVYGLFLGADEEVGSNGWRVGGSLGYTSADAEVKSRDASADISSYSASVYTGKGFSHGMNRINVMGGLAYTHHRIDSQRSVASLGQNLKADYTANTLQLFGEVGYAMGQYSKQGVEPFAGINISQQRVGSFQESGGFAALHGQSSNDTTTSTTLGVRAHSDFKLAGKDARLKGTLGWRHAFGDVKQTATMAFEGSSSFTVTGAPLARNTALLGLQAEVELSRRAALELGYQGEYGSGTRDHAVNVKMRWAY